MKKIPAILTILLCLCSCSGRKALQHPDWAPDVRDALNDFITLYGGGDEPRYAVFDFDNTSSIFDVSVQLMLYQLETMSFEMDPQAFRDVISREAYPCWDTFGERVEGICDRYEVLYDRYGPFDSKGLDEEGQEAIAKDPVWVEFASEMGCVYDDMEDLGLTSNAYVWSMDWFGGMTRDQLYELSYRSHVKYSQVPTCTRHIGDYTWVEGIQVTDNIRELWKALNENGIDVWVCSASCIEPVMAAVDAFGLHQWCKGVVAMTMAKDSDGRISGLYDYETGYASIAREDGGWDIGNVATGCQVWGDGKVQAIERCIAPLYGGRGPSAGFMDSTGDFGFCTEFSDLKLVVCFNRASRRVTDGGGLVSEAAIYERDVLHYDLRKANAAGDVLYVLQGRDENGLRTFRPSNATIRLGESEEQLFCDGQNTQSLQYFTDNKLSVKDIMETFSLLTSADDERNPLGFEYGFLTSYHGYLSR